MTWPPGEPYPPRGAPQPLPIPYGMGSGWTAQYGMGLPPPEAPRKSRRGRIVGVSVLAAVVFVAGAAAVLGVLSVRRTAVVAELRVGDCVADLPAQSRLVTLSTVDCADAHAGEVYSVLTMTETALPATTSAYQDECTAELSRTGPVRWPHLRTGLYVLHPTQQTWDRGDRSYTCIARFDPKRGIRPPGP